jgi:hypothetical protein
MKTAHDSLTFFLYILMRDHLPSGVIEAILRDRIEATRYLEPKFSCPQVQSLAEDWTRRLIGDLPENLPLDGQRFACVISNLTEARGLLRKSPGSLVDRMRAATLITEAMEQL